ncbi:hypothetical protein CJ199_16670, partial [Brevibacterium paucivorans]
HCGEEVDDGGGDDAAEDGACGDVEVAGGSEKKHDEDRAGVLGRITRPRMSESSSRIGETTIV